MTAQAIRDELGTGLEEWWIAVGGGTFGSGSTESFGSLEFMVRAIQFL